MPRKITPERREQLTTRDELERLINENSEEITSMVRQPDGLLPARPVSGFLDYHIVKENTDTEANSIVSAIAEFYLDKTIISEISYVKQKSNVDKITVSNLLFQMKTAEHAIIKLLEEIDNGNTSPRTFEVLSSLQRSKMEIVKHLAQFMVIMENNYKSLKEDYRVKKADEPQELGSGDYTVEDNSKDGTFRGTKKLMEMMRNAIPEVRAGDVLDQEDLNHTTDGK